MAHVQDLWEKTFSGRRVRTNRYGKGKRWQARYLDPDGRECSRTFERKQDAERFIVTASADVLRGAYVDPDAGKITFTDFAERWHVFCELRRKPLLGHFDHAHACLPLVSR